MLEAGSEIVKLTDFGIALTAEEDAGITRDGFIVGTPIYMPPEIFRGENGTIKSDIYSFGVTFYHFAMGAPPFVAKTNVDLYKQHSEKIPEKISKNSKDLPEEIDNLIIKLCMAKKPADRPDSMPEVISELKKIRKDNNI